jgi:hypothetical protein
MNTYTELSWFPEGYGYYPVKERDYDEGYFKKYETYEDTEIGRRINQSRVDIVNTFTKGDVLDVGIGCGTFLVSRPNTYGFDINPYGVEWLKEKGKFFNPYEQVPTRFAGVTFFDSLEHIKEPDILLSRFSMCYLFCCMPIYNDKEHVLRSKHFRPDEHYWYFTEDGFKWWMDTHGFDFIMQTGVESLLGREDIKTFVFRKSV